MPELIRIAALQTSVSETCLNFGSLSIQQPRVTLAQQGLLELQLQCRPRAAAARCICCGAGAGLAYQPQVAQCGCVCVLVLCVIFFSPPPCEKSTCFEHFLYRFVVCLCSGGHHQKNHLQQPPPPQRKRWALGVQRRGCSTRWLLAARKSALPNRGMQSIACSCFPP